MGYIIADFRGLFRNNPCWGKGGTIAKKMKAGRIKKREAPKYLCSMKTLRKANLVADLRFY